MYNGYNRLAEQPGVAHGTKKLCKKISISFGYPWMSAKKSFPPFGPAAWPARGNIYINVLFYYIEESTQTNIKSETQNFRVQPIGEKRNCRNTNSCPPWISRSSDRDVEYPKFSVLLKQIVKVWTVWTICLNIQLE